MDDTGFRHSLDFIILETFSNFGGSLHIVSLLLQIGN